ncbi:MAG: glycosyltransferase family 2 protein [Bacteroidota bacterium]|nr:glycosyltransferase family 2 protein [Bacteroidota bacterium]
MPKKRESLSVIIPIYNEEETIPLLYERLAAVLKNLALASEIVFVNDGSRDRSLALLKELASKDKRLRIIDLARNFGHQIAISAGIDHASGNAVVLMDGDLQDPPEMIATFIKKWKEGFEVVYAVRKKRKENLLKRSGYVIFYRLLRKISSVEIPLDSGDFSLMDRRIVDTLRAMPERNRFIRGIRSWVGFRQCGIEYERDRRYAGEVKYTFAKLLRLATDGIFAFSYLPLRVATYLGLTVAATSFLLAVFYFIEKIVSGIDTKGWASTMIIILFLGGVQLLTIGIMGEYVGRIYDEVKQRPLYIVNEKIGWRKQTV